ncbi:MAG: sulfite exporter TauE/SafE family protein [Thermodesulfovibrionales bacterium]
MSVVIGLLAGFFGGLLGIGGGVVMIPMMVGFLGVSQHRAHGTSMAAMVFIGLAGAATYGLKGSVDLAAGLYLAASAMATAHLGARYASKLSELRLRRCFGVFLVLVSGLMVSKPYISGFVIVAASGVGKALVLLVAGVVTGFVAGLMGVGGGAIMVPAMVLFVGLSQHVAQGTSLLTMVPAGVVGAWTHMSLGNVDRRLLWGLVPGVIAGSYLGGSAALFLPAGTLRVVFAVVLAWTGVRYLRR